METRRVSYYEKCPPMGGDLPTVQKGDGPPSDMVWVQSFTLDFTRVKWSVCNSHEDHGNVISEDLNASLSCVYKSRVKWCVLRWSPRIKVSRLKAYLFVQRSIENYKLTKLNWKGIFKLVCMSKDGKPKAWIGLFVEKFPFETHLMIIITSEIKVVKIKTSSSKL